jgi:two-component system OmpR family response regulator/two-component system KDP operon response regulator KdpE
MTERRRILVVDDQREILDLTASVLDGAGYQTVISSSGVDALRRLGEEPFDLVLLDINMPGMDGWETLRLLRADDRLAGMPVFMFSVKGEIADKVHSLQEGATGYVTKPFIVDDLVARIDRLLRASVGPTECETASGTES